MAGQLGGVHAGGNRGLRCAPRPIRSDSALPASRTTQSTTSPPRISVRLRMLTLQPTSQPEEALGGFDINARSTLCQEKPIQCDLALSGSELAEHRCRRHGSPTIMHLRHVRVASASVGSESGPKYETEVGQLGDATPSQWIVACVRGRATPPLLIRALSHRADRTL